MNRLLGVGRYRFLLQRAGLDGGRFIHPNNPDASAQQLNGLFGHFQYRSCPFQECLPIQKVLPVVEPPGLERICLQPSPHRAGAHPRNNLHVFSALGDRGQAPATQRTALFLRQAARQCGRLRTNVRGKTASALLAWARLPTACARSSAVAMCALPDRCTQHGLQFADCSLRGARAQPARSGHASLCLVARFDR